MRQYLTISRTRYRKRQRYFLKNPPGAKTKPIRNTPENILRAPVPITRKALEKLEIQISTFRTTHKSARPDRKKIPPKQKTSPKKIEPQTSNNIIGLPLHEPNVEKQPNQFFSPL